MKDKTDFPQIFRDSSRERAEQDCACPADASIFARETAREEGAETDCACAPAVSSNLQYATPNLHPANLWGIPPLLYRVPLPEGHQLVFNPAGPAGAVVLNSPAARILDSFATPAPLTDPVARQLATLGLLVSQPSQATTPHVSHFTFHVLTLWLHLTARCNLRCTYCYAPRGQADMPAEVGREAVDGAIRSAQAHGFRVLKLKYAGGEPTLNLSTLYAVHEYARARVSQVGLELREVLLTNGTTLTPALLEWLRDEGIRLSISLDGLGSVHNRQRSSVSGDGSFAAVAEGIEQALALGLTPHLSITVTRHNVNCLAEVVAFALGWGLPFNLNFVRPSPGRPDLTPPVDRLIAGLQAALREVERRLEAGTRLGFALSGLLDRCDFGAPHQYPCGVGHAYIVVGPKGKVAACHMEMERTVGTVWDEDPLAAVRRDDLHNPPVEEKQGCRECPWRYACAGGCPLLAQQYWGTPAASSPYCAVYRAILPELLRLEGLRILRSHIPA